MNSTTFRFLRRLCAMAVMIVLGAAQPARAATTYLVNPGVYSGTPSSTFSGSPTETFDTMFDGDNISNWAIDGFAGNNPQGRDEGWISVQLNHAYQITDLRFAPRRASGTINGIDTAYAWVSATPFGVDVTSLASTSAFLTTPTGLSPNLSLGPFPSNAAVNYSFGTALTGQYLLGRFINTTDHNNDRNLGVGSFEVGVVPEPGTMALSAFGLASLLSYGAWRRARRRRGFFMRSW